MAKPGYINARLDDALDKQVREYTLEHDRTVSQVIRAALRAFFAAEELKAKEVQNG